MVRYCHIFLDARKPPPSLQSVLFLAQLALLEKAVPVPQETERWLRNLFLSAQRPLFTLCEAGHLKPPRQAASYSASRPRAGALDF